MPLAIRFVIGGLVLVLAAVVAKRVSPTAGGLVVAFPTLIATSLLFEMRASSHDFSSYADGIVWGMLPLAGFAVTLALVARAAPSWAALLSGFAAWGVLTALLFVIRAHH